MKGWDLQDVIIWWLAIQVLAIIFFPVTARLGRSLPDRGYSLSKVLGLLLPAYSFWLLSSFGFLSNNRFSIILVVIVVGAASWILVPGAKNTLSDLWRRDRRTVVLVELLFAAAFSCWALVRAYDPAIAGTEKPMEFAFLNGVLRSERFPPADPWLSGYSISYYYFGYVIVGLLTKLTGVAPSIAFNLAIAMLFALTMVGAFGVAYNLARAAGRDGLKRALGSHPHPSPLPEGEGTGSFGPILCGLLGALFTAVMGNLEGFLEMLYSRAVLPIPFWNWVGIQNLDKPYLSGQWYPSDWMWWFRASRVIADYDPVSHLPRDYTINEFPMFSFLLGDLHPHVLALPFTILALALAVNLLLSESEPSLDSFRRRPWGFLGLALVIGGLGFLNSWDMPTYALIMAGAFALKKLLARSLSESSHRMGSESAFRWHAIKESAVFLVLLLATAVLLYLPFYIGFSSQASGLGLVAVRSKLHQFLIMWAPFVFLAGAFIVAQLALRRQSLSADRREPAVPGASFGAALPVVGGFLNAFGGLQVWVVALLAGMLAAGASALNRRLGSGSEQRERRGAVDAFVIFLVLLAGVLLLVTELVFLRDVFGNRMNTVFKVYYQSWTLLAIAGAYVVYYFSSRLGAGRLLRGRLKERPNKSRTRARDVLRLGHRPAVAGQSSRLADLGAHAAFAIAIFLLAIGFVYPVAAIPARANGFRGVPQLDGTAFLANSRHDDYEAMSWLQRNVTGTPVILEASGGSYSEFGRVSETTGLPTVLGWDGHELQWRGSGDEAARRKADIDAIYRGTDSRAALQLLNKYGVAYVYAGSLERQKYADGPPVWLSKFSEIGDVVYQNPGVTIFRIRVGKQ